jgi:hypothetical protein
VGNRFNENLPVAKLTLSNHFVSEEQMNIVANKYRGSGEYFIVFNELIETARRRGTVTYQEMADLVGLPTTGNYMGKEVGHLVGEISEDQHDRGRPMLSAIVVEVGFDSLPGSGFFKLAADLKKYNGSDDPKQQRDFWEAEKRSVHEFWRKKF